jgi:hypothetical protein
MRHRGDLHHHGDPAHALARRRMDHLASASGLCTDQDVTVYFRR